MTRKLKRILLIGGILVGSLVLAALMSTMRKEPPRKEVENLPLLVEVVEVEPVSASFTIRSQGVVQPVTETVLSAEVSGAIVDISPAFIAGGVFQAGEVLLRIDPTNYSVAVKQAQALVKQRQIEYDGASKLRSQGYRAESEYASAAAALASAEAELVRARRNLERTEIRLPYDGIVRGKDADIGQFVSPGTRLGVTFSTDVAEVRLPLTDRDLAFVDLPYAAKITATGEASGPVVILSAAQRGRPTEWPARIVRSEGIVDENSRVTYAVARVEDPYRLRSEGAPLPVGSFVSASIDGRSTDGLLRVPRYALRGSDQLLFVDDGNVLKIRNVTVVRADADYAYLGAGAASGDRVIITTLESPINGMLVRTKDDPPRAGESEDEKLASKTEEPAQ
jgi:RND family efflux transporter MFP subunit